MLLLEYHNKIIEDTLLERFNNTPADGKFEAIETTIADFDGVVFHIFTSGDSNNLFNVSVSIKCWSVLAANGVQDLLKQYYGASVVAAENGFNATIQVDTAKPPQDKVKLAHEIALLKRHCLAAPFYKCFNDIEAKKSGGPLIEVPYRDDEAFYLKTDPDRVTVIFAISFKDQDDVVFAKVFMQEYQDARRTMSNAPAVTYSQKEPPGELKGVKNLRVGDNNGYVSFVLFAPHISGTKKHTSVDNIMTFRNYLHYHIKCSKAYLHTRMRNRVKTFLQVLNRAKSDVGGGEKKTITGKTFRRADDPQSKEEEFNI
jgi:actin related protein 2/3 complex subunit 2